MDLLGLQKDIDAVRQLLDAQQAKIAALESQIAQDVNQIADKLIAAVLPEVQAMRKTVEQATNKAAASVDQLTLTVNASVQETLVLARRINGSTIRFELGPELQ